MSGGVMLWVHSSLTYPWTLKDFDRGEVGAAKTAEEERARVEKIILLSSRILIFFYTSFAFHFCHSLMFLLSIFVAPLCFCYPNPYVFAIDFIQSL
jgi:hypothetical protein